MPLSQSVSCSPIKTRSLPDDKSGASGKLDFEMLRRNFNKHSRDFAYYAFGLLEQTAELPSRNLGQSASTFVSCRPPQHARQVRPFTVRERLVRKLTTLSEESV
jgi:hypothetical protein